MLMQTAKTLWTIYSLSAAEATPTSSLVEEFQRPPSAQFRACAANYRRVED